MKQIGDRPLTNAEKQKRFRERRKAQGLRRIQTWGGKDGFVGKPTDEGAYTQITIHQLTGGLKRLLAKYELEDWQHEIIFAEILVQAELLIKRYDKILAQFKAESKGYAVTVNESESE